MFGKIVAKLGIFGLRRNIRKIGVTEDYFIKCLNGIDGYKEVSSLDDISIPEIEKISNIVRDMVFHLTALNTFVSLVGEENIGEDFDFSSQTCPKKAYRIAGFNELEPSQVTDYIKDRQLYVRSLLDPSFNKNPD